ncbi:MAG: hypothetical protein IKB88_00170 [Clostridia bacterium]|nr:hypothetical protein [Clostridia bacterium]
MDYYVCRTCGAGLHENDKYCAECGRPACAVKYDPTNDVEHACIYGPQPLKRVYKCKKCGKGYTIFEMVETTKYCTACGGELIKIFEGD